MQRPRRRVAGLVGVGLLVATALAGCSNASAGTSAPGVGSKIPSGGPAPGVTSNQIVVGAVATESGSLSTGFGEIVNGVQAYLDMVNAQGGVNGRKIVLRYNLDDAATGTNNETQIRNLVEQDKVFAIVGVGSPFFSAASYLNSTGTPTFGYVVTDNWTGPPNLFGAYGSDLDYNAERPFAPYVAKELSAKNPALLAYSYPPSQQPCQAFGSALTQWGPAPAFEDLAFSLGGDASVDAQQMTAKHVDMAITCMEGPDNLSLVRALQQQGKGTVPSVWLNGYSRTVVSQNPGVTDGVIFGVQHVPFEAAAQFPGKYPGMQQYLTEMKKYEPQWVYDDVAFQGWVNAAQFVAGLRAIGRNVTQTRLVAAINQETAFNAGGLIPPVNWTKQHTNPPNPVCLAYVEAEHGTTKVVFAPAPQVLVCQKPDSPTPVTPNPGTPGA